MPKPIRIGFAIFVVALLGMELLSGSSSRLQWLAGKLAWGSAMPFQQAADSILPMVWILPIFLLIPFAILLAFGLLALSNQK
jgi:hypothetical protein